MITTKHFINIKKSLKMHFLVMKPICSRWILFSPSVTFTATPLNRRISAT